MPHAATRQASLLIKLPNRPSEERPLEGEHFTIGRKADNDLAIEDPAVSGHHARITKIHAVHFIEDLKSTNGTLVNDRTIDRHQLRDTDVITIGRHRLIYRDGSVAPASAGPVEETDRTVALTGRGSVPAPATVSAMVRVLSGKTDRPDYSLVKHITVIGSQEDAGIRLTGWFAPAHAAAITRRQHTFFISSARTGRPIMVNGQAVTKECELRDKDRIEVAGVTLLFQMSREKKS
jgi:pSer/pThr/pTyr-binding forkhead associated (FHA) protein